MGFIFETLSQQPQNASNPRRHSLTNVYLGKPARIKVGRLFPLINSALFCHLLRDRAEIRTVSTMKLTAFLPPLNDTLFKNAGRSKGDPIGSRQERNGVRGNNRSPQRNGRRGNIGLFII
jgi:hypothetical protein